MTKKLASILQLLIFGILIFIAGCASLSSSVTPDKDLSKSAKYYVLRHDRDNRHIDKIIQAEMSKLGLNATSGPKISKPKDIDVIVSYQDHWMWDVSTYLLKLIINFRDANTHIPLATGQSHRPSLVRKSPQFMAREILQSIFNKVK